VVAITVIILEGRRFQALHPLGKVLLWMVVLFAVASAIQYFWSFWKHLDERVKRRASRRRMTIEAEEKEPEEKDVAAH
jgi:flagellar basal body-associated protein FliL